MRIQALALAATVVLLAVSSAKAEVTALNDSLISELGDQAVERTTPFLCGNRGGCDGSPPFNPMKFDHRP